MLGKIGAFLSRLLLFFAGFGLIFIGLKITLLPIFGKAISGVPVTKTPCKITTREDGIKYDKDAYCYSWKFSVNGVEYGGSKTLNAKQAGFPSRATVYYLSFFPSCNDIKSSEGFPILASILYILLGLFIVFVSFKGKVNLYLFGSKVAHTESQNNYTCVNNGLSGGQQIQAGNFIPKVGPVSFCPFCGCQINSTDVSFCPKCGKQVASLVAAPQQPVAPVVQQPVHPQNIQVPYIQPGFSAVADSAEFKSKIGKMLGCGSCFNVFVLIFVFLGMTSYLYFSENKSLNEALTYGGLTTALFFAIQLAIVFYQWVVDSRWDGRVTEKYERYELSKYEGQSDTFYYVCFVTNSGKKKVTKDRYRFWYEYLNVGDVVRYHPGIQFYEKFDKNHDGFLLCPCCRKENSLNNIVCTSCKTPLFR